ncbi:DUF1365 domain-containing protein [Acidiphilium sp.]|uniref:DUF1365 domain-containing protein n=1 Tax=Acidiphilium sp. TaxID=527 RepID=UPI003CFC54CF
MTEAMIYAGVVGHIRYAAPRHKFTYRMWMLAVDLDDLDDLAARSSLFRHNRFGLIGINDRDHGPRDGTSLRPWVEAALAENGLAAFGAHIRLMTIPRIIGYAFNPISFYFCADADGRLGAVLHEVNNTFGDQIAYVIPVAPGAGLIRQRVAKAMHVSPLFDMQGRYDFTFTRPGPKFRLSLRYGAETRRMSATMVLDATPATDNAMRGQLVRMPLVAIKVIAAIHWEAIKTLARGAKFHREPARTHQPIIRGDAV